MLPDLPSRNSSILMNSTRRRKDIKSPRTSRDYKVDVLMNQLSPHHKFKPIDFKENLIISINSTEAMRVKEYDRLCQIVTKFEHKKVRENLVKTKEKKDFGHYAQKKGFNIMRKFEILQNQHLIEKFKCRTSMGIVRWKEKDKSNIKGIVKPGIKSKRILSETRLNIDSDGDVIKQDVGFDTTDFFKTLVTGKVTTDKDEKLKDLDPDQKKKVFEKLSTQKHVMMPLEIKQIKNALQKEENQNPSSNNLFVQDFSNIQGASPLVESPKGYNNDFDMKYYSKYQPDPFKTLSPRLKEMVISNKDALSNFFSLIFTEEILIKNNDKLKKILTIQKQSEQIKNEEPNTKLYKTMLKEAITSRSKFSVVDNNQHNNHSDSVVTEDNFSNFNAKLTSTRQQSMDTRTNGQKQRYLEEQKIDVAEEVGYRFWINAFETDHSAKVSMKRFLRGYPEITSGGEDSTENVTKFDADSLYSEFQQPGVFSSFEEVVESEDISDFLKRSQVHLNPEEKSKMKKSKTTSKLLGSK